MSGQSTALDAYDPNSDGYTTVDYTAHIELAYHGVLSSTTIAVRLGEPLSTIKAYLRRGLLALHTQIHLGVKESDETCLR